MPKAAQSEFDVFLKRHPDIKHVDALCATSTASCAGSGFPLSEAGKIWKSGVELPRCMLFLDPTGDDLDPGGRSGKLGDPDGTATPVPGSLAIVPWADEPTAQVLLQMRDPIGFPNAGHPSILPAGGSAGALARLRKLGLNPVVAVELEFYLFAPGRNALGAPLLPKNPVTGETESSKQPYSIDDLDAYGTFIQAVAGHCIQQNIPASTAITEYSPGQFEINPSINWTRSRPATRRSC